jgi:hypothetical protein
MKNAKKIGFRGHGTIIIFLMIIALVFAAMTACEGPEGQQGEPGKDGKDADVISVITDTKTGEKYWAINGESTKIKIDDEAKLAFDPAPFPADAEGVKKPYYYANEPLALETNRVKVFVQYKLFKQQLQPAVADSPTTGASSTYFMVYEGKKVSTAGGANLEKGYPTDKLEDEEITIYIYGPAPEPIHFTVLVKVFNFTGTLSVGPDSGSNKRYGIDWRCSYLPSADDVSNFPDVDTTSVAILAAIQYKWYRDGEPVDGASGTFAQNKHKFEPIGYGAYTVEIKALGFCPRSVDIEDIEPTFITVAKMAAYLADSPNIGSRPTTAHYVKLIDDADDMPATIRPAIIEGFRKNKNYLELDLTECGYEGILDSGFEDCHALIGLSLSDLVETVGEKAFNNCPNLAYIDVDADNDELSSEGGVLYNVDASELIFWPPKKSGSTTVTIPASVTTIRGYAFAYCGSLRNLTIPATVTSIKTDAISVCSNLGKLTFYPEALIGGGTVTVTSGVSTCDSVLWPNAIRVGDLQAVMERDSGLQLNATATTKGGKGIYIPIVSDVIDSWKIKEAL